MEERTLSDFIRNLNSNLRKSFRHYERLSLKIINTTYAIKFNNICLQEHLCPKTIIIRGQTKNPWKEVETQLLQRNRINAERMAELNLKKSST